MDEEAIQKMFENMEKLTNKIKKIKKVGDYGINCTGIRESIIYPEIGGMRQDI
jgi:ribosomal protein S19